MKPIYKSKTILFNILLASLTAFSDNIELVREYMSNGGYIMVLMFVSGMGVYLRSVTTDPLER